MFNDDGAVTEDAVPVEAKLPIQRKLLRPLGPGLTTGAADDDPGGIATYSQVGAAVPHGIAAQAC